MNETDRVAIDWISRKDKLEREFIAGSGKGMGFRFSTFISEKLTKYLPKKLYRRKLIFYEEELKLLEVDPIIVVVSGNQVVDHFRFSERDKDKYDYNYVASRVKQTLNVDKTKYRTFEERCMKLGRKPKEVLEQFMTNYKPQ
jgi:hypothetical protein